MDKVYIVQVLNYKHNYYEEANSPEIYVYKNKSDALDKLLSCFKEKLQYCQKKFNLNISKDIAKMQGENEFVIRNHNINYTGRIFTRDLI